MWYPCKITQLILNLYVYTIYSLSHLIVIPIAMTAHKVKLTEENKFLHEVLGGVVLKNVHLWPWTVETDQEGVKLLAHLKVPHQMIDSQGWGDKDAQVSQKCSPLHIYTSIHEVTVFAVTIFIVFFGNWKKKIANWWKML